jgi:DNA mismatch repair protein MutS2
VQVTEVAGTPSSFRTVADRATLESLEFHRVLDAVAARAVSGSGAAAVRARRPVADVVAVQAELALVEEYRRALETLDDVAPRAMPDVRESLRVLETAGSVLDAAALGALGEAIGAMRANSEALRRLEQAAPAVARIRVEVPSAGLARAIVKAIGPGGEVTDDASPDVSRARHRVRAARDRLVRHLESFARTLPPEFQVEGASVTVRDGRFVVPVRREAKGRVGGLVHGESASGATVFFEPVDAVDLGNDVTAAEEEERRAVLHLLRDLTERARRERPELAAGWSMSVRMDEVYARARYAADMDASLPTVTAATAGVAVFDARHPLVGGPSGAVPFSLALEQGQRTLVVSGPNAGGKTVLLKAIGLLSAMTQSGIIPPVGPNTRIPVFARMHADIGDHQSIEANLSTFSAHLEAIRTVVDEAETESLVLLDELGSGTDPMEGAAIAGAVLTRLNARAGMTVATTHLNQLKELAASVPGMVNASLAFDAETLAPTFRLLVGKPGRSYGIAIARRLGLDAEVVDHAVRLLPEAVRTFDAALADLERREQDVEAREREAEAMEHRQEAERIRLESARRDADERASQLRDAERELERAGRARAREFLLEARKRVEEALGLARAAVSEATAREARRLVEEGVEEEGDALRRLEEEARKKGWKVTGRRGHGPIEQPRAPEAPRPHGSSAGVSDAVAEAASSVVDLRGMRVDEAEATLLAAIDTAVVAELPILRVIHGKGTGALRAAVHAMVRMDGRVARYAFAAADQGGAGVTVLELRS